MCNDPAVRFHHVKLLARDIERLVDFYQEALGCELLKPIRDVEDAAVSKAIGVDGLLRLAQLSLPGQEEGGVLLEIYTIDGESDDWTYRPGQGQICFVVDDVHSAAERVVGAGGSTLGEISDWVTPAGTFRFVFLRDPEGNIIDVVCRIE